MSHDLVDTWHKEIVADFARHSTEKSKHFDLPKYLGTSNKLYSLNNATEKQIAKAFLSRHKAITEVQFLDLLNALYAGDSFNERTFGTKLLVYKKQFKPLFTPARIYGWLGKLSGWCEVDSLCQSTFTADDLLADWASWSKMLDKLSHDKSISRRRASLVLLCKPVRTSSDGRFADVAFANLDRLKGEKDILISKAVSWLLRDLIKHHRARVSDFLSINRDILPKFVVREVQNKLVFGKKFPKAS